MMYVKKPSKCPICGTTNKKIFFVTENKLICRKCGFINYNGGKKKVEHV